MRTSPTLATVNVTGSVGLKGAPMVGEGPLRSSEQMILTEHVSWTPDVLLR